jgi:hypothetical protein
MGRRSRAKSILGVTMLAVCCHTARPLHAEEPAPLTARERFQRGVEAAEHGELARAAAEFEAAYAMNPKPAVLYNLGQTQSALGRPVEAVHSLRLYLASEPTPDAGRVREVENLIEVNERSIGTLELEVSPSAAALEVDAAPVALADGKLTLAAGRHVIVARLDGYVPGVLNVDVVGATDSRVELELEPLAPAPPPPASSAGAVAAARPMDVAQPPPPPARGATTPALVGFGTAGLGLATLGFGVAFAMSAHDLDDASRTSGHCDARGCDAVGLPLRSAAHHRGDIATGLFVAGGALLVGGISLYFILGSSSRGSAVAYASQGR